MDSAIDYAIISDILNSICGKCEDNEIESGMLGDHTKNTIFEFDEGYR
jgi:hypothetical protein